MQSPLSIYKQVAKDFGVTEAETVSPVGKSTFVLEQIQQQRAVINRLMFDLATTRFHKEAAKDPKTKDAYRKKEDDYSADLSQLLDSVRVSLKLIDELRAEYPELAIEE